MSGLVEARHVFPGDRVMEDGAEVTVTAVSQNPTGYVHIVTRTDGGGQIVFEHDRDDLVRVVSDGTLDPEAA